jgi:hypothetical protein
MFKMLNEALNERVKGEDQEKREKKELIDKIIWKTQIEIFDALND